MLITCAFVPQTSMVLPLASRRYLVTSSSVSTWTSPVESITSTVTHEHGMRGRVTSNVMSRSVARSVSTISWLLRSIETKLLRWEQDGLVSAGHGMGSQQRARNH